MIELRPSVALASPGESVTGYQYVVRFPPDNGRSYTPWNPSTVAMVQSMESAPIPGATVLDLGAGSGVLAVLASQFGAASVTAAEYIPDIAAVSLATFAANGVSVRMLERDDGADYGVILANLGDAQTLLDLIPRCDYLIGSAKTTRELQGGGRGTPPVWSVTAEDVIRALIDAGRHPGLDEFADGWAVVSG